MADLIWNAGTPPKRGPYRVKSDGPSANVGYRYWFGDVWGPLYSQRKYATAKNTSRKVTLKWPVLWASPAPAPTIRSNEFAALLMAYRIAEMYKTGAIFDLIIEHVDARLNKKATP